MTPSNLESDPPDLRGYEVVVAVGGGIAAYKVCAVVSRLVQRDVGVTVAMTKAATKFVGPLTFQALSARPVLTSLWRGGDAGDPQHLGLMRRANVLLIAPATANLLAKIAHGICDDLVSTMVTAATCPVLIAAAMNDVMWANPAVQANAATLRGYGYRLIEPAEGWLACRSVGAGRMAEPEALVAEVARSLVAARRSDGIGSNPRP